MLLWIGFAVLAVAATGALAWPLRGKSAHIGLSTSDADSAVYRDQLAEIEADRERGLLSEAEAKGARVEVARRLLQHAAPDGSTRLTASTEERGHAAATQYVLLGVLAGIPAAAVALYLVLGSPSLPALPLASRSVIPGVNASVALLVAKVEDALKENPGDGRGWEVLAPVYMRLGRSADAAHAYSESIRLNGESVPRLMGFAEASLLAGKGIVGDEVRRASSRILALEPGRAEPRAWLALGKEQDGDLAGAAADYKAMLEEAGADAPWRQPVEERLEAVAQRLAGTAAPLAGTADGAASKDAPKDARGTPGGAPGGRDAAAIAGLPAGEQARMIEGMVTRLAERLRENGKDIGGWQRLIRSYAVLGRKDEAKAAIADARKNFSDDEGVQVKLDELARSLGLGS